MLGQTTKQFCTTPKYSISWMDIKATPNCEEGMNAAQVLVHGTLKPDGTLELQDTPSLPAGPVEVLIRAVPAIGPPTETWLQFLQRGRAELLAQGEVFRSKEDIDAEFARERLRDDEAEGDMERLQSPPG
jgi:hypothetical protein